MKIRIINRCPDIALPSRGSELAAGYDLRAAVDAALTIAPGARALVPTGITIAIPPGYEGQLRPRSGLALKSGVTLLNSPGTIDADYRGEIGVILVNHGEAPFVVEGGDRVAQLVIAAHVVADLEAVATLEETPRGVAGFGSSGTR
jgi:dUTP pyrophosphatase